MTTVSGNLFDTQSGPFPQVVVTLKRAGGVAGINGGAVGPDTKPFMTSSAGLPANTLWVDNGTLKIT